MAELDIETLFEKIRLERKCTPVSVHNRYESFIKEMQEFDFVEFTIKDEDNNTINDIIAFNDIDEVDIMTNVINNYLTKYNTFREYRK